MLARPVVNLSKLFADGQQVHSVVVVVAAAVVVVAVVVVAAAVGVVAGAVVVVAGAVVVVPAGAVVVVVDERQGALCAQEVLAVHEMPLCLVRQLSCVNCPHVTTPSSRKQHAPFCMFVGFT